MKFASFDHKGLAALYQRGDATKLDSRLVTKLRRQFTFLNDMKHADELRALRFWKSHRLSDGRWALHVTANWRLTFAIDDEAGELCRIDLEDYH